MDITHIVRAAKKTMLQYKGHPPTILIEDEDARYIKMLDALPETALARQKLLFMTGRILAKEEAIGDVQQLVWICETWFTIKSREEMETAPSPSNDPT